MKKIILYEDDFAELVAGREIMIDGVKIILSDIGFEKMLHIIQKTWREQAILKMKKNINGGK